jgi:hypothetical protein
MRDSILERDSHVARREVLVPVTTAISLTKRLVTAYKVRHNAVFTGASLFARTVAGTVAVSLLIADSEEIDTALTSAGLAIDATAEKFKVGTTFVYRAASGFYTKAAATAILFSANDVINGANKWGAFLVQVDSAGTVTTKGALANAFATEGAAVAALPAADASKAVVGYISVQAKNATWTANTDDLTAGSDCVVAHFVNKTTAARVPLTADLSPVAAKVVDGVLSTDFTQLYMPINSYILAVQTTDGTGALTDAILSLQTRPYPLQGEATF